MTGGIDIAGDIAAGALLARAVEPDAGEHHHGATHDHGLCLNCGTALRGDFCHVCGQTGHIHRSLASIGHDLLHGVWHFEGKIWRTLPMLVFHPGALTRRYIAGERARFVSPLAMFLFSVFLMFAVISSFGGDLADLPPSAEVQREAVAKIDKELVKAKADLTRAETRRIADPTAVSTDEIAGLRAAVTALDKARQSAGGDGFSVVGVKTGWYALDKGIAKANANPGLLLYKLQSSAYKYSWALIPISVPFVALLFLWRRRFALYDHAIFVIYSLTFMMLLVVVLSLLLTIDAPGWLFGWLAVLAPPVHMFAQLRGAYGLRKRSALWRTAALGMFAALALTTFAMLLLLLGLTG